MSYMQMILYRGSETCLSERIEIPHKDHIYPITTIVDTFIKGGLQKLKDLPEYPVDRKLFSIALGV